MEPPQILRGLLSFAYGLLPVGKGQVLDKPLEGNVGVFEVLFLTTTFFFSGFFLATGRFLAAGFFLYRIAARIGGYRHQWGGCGESQIGTYRIYRRPFAQYRARAADAFCNEGPGDNAAETGHRLGMG